jgi:hypothetical protein
VEGKMMRAFLDLLLFAAGVIMLVISGIDGFHGDYDKATFSLLVAIFAFWAASK